MKSRKSYCTTPGVGVGNGVSKKLTVKVFYGMGKGLSGELSCPCDRSVCNLQFSSNYFEAFYPLAKAEGYSFVHVHIKFH